MNRSREDMSGNSSLSDKLKKSMEENAEIGRRLREGDYEEDPIASPEERNVDPDPGDHVVYEVFEVGSNGKTYVQKAPRGIIICGKCGKPKEHIHLSFGARKATRKYEPHHHRQHAEERRQECFSKQRVLLDYYTQTVTPFHG